VVAVLVVATLLAAIPPAAAARTLKDTEDIQGWPFTIQYDNPQWNSGRLDWC
jgi:hypothetical protein